MTQTFSADLSIRWLGTETKMMLMSVAFGATRSMSYTSLREEAGLNSDGSHLRSQSPSVRAALQSMTDRFQSHNPTVFRKHLCVLSVTAHDGSQCRRMRGWLGNIVGNIGTFLILEDVAQDSRCSQSIGESVAAIAQRATHLGSFAVLPRLPAI